jgi:DNA-binding NarL/FixJ family response regulator
MEAPRSVEARSMEAIIRIVIADDHVAVRQMLRATLDAQPDMQVMAEAADGAQAVKAALEQQPDVLLLDVKMSGDDGISAAREVARALPHTKILMLTALEEDQILFSCLQAGAHGFLLKSATVEEIIEGVRTVASRGSVLSPRSAAQLIGHFREQSSSAAEGPTDEDLASLERLTSRERDVLALLSAGLSNREIGDKLFISELTAKTHVQNLLRRLEIRDRFQAAVLGIRLGLAEAPRLRE